MGLSGESAAGTRGRAASSRSRRAARSDTDASAGHERRAHPGADAQSVRYTGLVSSRSPVPLGRRIIEVPEDLPRTELRDSKSGFVRQLYDMQKGARAGEWSPLMKAAVAKLTLDDLVSIAAYASSRQP